MVIKKHINREDYKGFTTRFLLFADLTEAEKVLLENNTDQFEDAFPETRLFPDPILPKPRVQKYFLQDAVIIADEDSAAQKAARVLQRSMRGKYGVEIPIQHQLIDIAADEKPLILIGASHQNARTLALHKNLQMSGFDRHFPGKNGWGVTTFQGILQHAGPRYVIACNAENSVTAVDYFAQNAVDVDSENQLRWLHHVELDLALPPEYHDFDLWLRQLKHSLEPVTNAWLDSDHKQPFGELFLKVLSPQSAEPLIYNAALLDIGLAAIRYYQMTGNEHALELFLEMMRGCLEYHMTDGANVFISDLDFRLGQICAYWSWIENHPKINATQRRQFTQLMLGMMRITHDYYMQLWAHREMNEQGVLHNHQTFPARTLCFGWRYFSRLGVADAEIWKNDADALFQKLDQSRTKYMENASSYESMVPHHVLDWHELTGRKVSEDFQHTLASFAMREWVMRDNFFNGVEYGDCAVTFAKTPPVQIALWLEGEKPLFQQLRALEGATAAQFPPQILPAIFTFEGTVSSDPNIDIADITTGWSLLPLELKLSDSYRLLGEPKKRFDKLAWKSAWMDDGAYVAIEGFGNKTVSHAHNAANSVIRANFGGRVWLVGNGYGKKRNVIGAQEAFASRELGPIDHNMLVIRDANGEQILTPMNAVVLDHGKAPLPFSVTRLDDYAGCDWTRHLFVLANIGLISIDKVTARKSCFLPKKFSLDWNILGEIQQTPIGALSNQKGVQLHFDHFGTANPQWGFNASASWYEALTDHHYPFTSAPLQKCMLRNSQATNISKDTAIFVSGFWINGEVKKAIWNAQECNFQIDSEKTIFSAGEHSASWGTIATDENSAVIKIAL
jgi:hypothetical protein